MHKPQTLTKTKQILLVVGIILFVLVGKFVIEGIRYAPVLYQLLFHKEIGLKRAENNKINILLLGIGGGKHDGPNLTDTIIFASVDSASQTAHLVSLPRDLWVKEIDSKINKAYANGEDKKEGTGLPLVKAVVGRVVNQKIDYVVRVDFTGFVQIIDLLGGIDVEVERTLDDYEYPISGKETDTCEKPEEDLPLLATASSQLDAFPCRYEHLYILKGKQHMDGELALKFVRSRHAVGAEGSDFARSKRQEKVIQAVREKVFSAGTLLNPLKVSALYETVKSSIDTDISQDEFDDFIRLAQKMQHGKISSAVIDAGDEEREGLLINPPLSEEYGYQWVLIPRAGNGVYTEIQAFVKKQTEIKVADK